MISYFNLPIHFLSSSDFNSFQNNLIFPSEISHKKLLESVESEFKVYEHL